MDHPKYLEEGLKEFLNYLQTSQRIDERVFVVFEYGTIVEVDNKSSTIAESAIAVLNNNPELQAIRIVSPLDCGYDTCFVQDQTMNIKNIVCLLNARCKSKKVILTKNCQKDEFEQRVLNTVWYAHRKLTFSLTRSLTHSHSFRY